MVTNYFKGMITPQCCRIGKRYPKTCTGVCMPVENNFVTDFNTCECSTKNAINHVKSITDKE